MHSVIRLITGFADKYDMFPDSGSVITCVSGGADSMCLLEALLEISRTRGFTVCAAHFNHMLRGADSDGDQAFVQEYCNAGNILCYTGSGDVRGFARRRGIGTEEAARDMRYDFFYETALRTGAVRIVTAHTADDNTETMLLNLTRGAGTAGLSGIPPVRELRAQACGAGCGGAEAQFATAQCAFAHGQSVKVVRPMLCISRPDIMDFIGQRGLPYVTDKTNELDIYTRNRIRHLVTPVLRDINPKLNEAAAAAAEIARADEEYLSRLAEQFISSEQLTDGTARATGAAEATGAAGAAGAAGWGGAVSSLDATRLRALPFAVSGRVIRQICGGGLSYSHVKAILELCDSRHPSASLSIPGMTVFREYDRIAFSAKRAAAGAAAFGAAAVGSSGTCVTSGDNKAADPGAAFEPIYPEDGLTVQIPGANLNMTCKIFIYEEPQSHNLSSCPEGIAGQARNDAVYPAFSEHPVTGCGLPTINKSLTSFLFQYADLCGKMSVRPRREGDRITLYGRNCTKTLKKLFIECRIPAHKRGLIPVVADGNGVLAVYGLGRGNRAVPKPGELAVLIEFVR